jgi:hypothetical protein
MRKTWKRLVLVGSLIGVGIFSSLSTVWANSEKKLSFTFSQSYVSRYIWRGQDVYSEDDSAYQPSVDLTVDDVLGGSLGFNIWGSFPLTSGHEDLTELDYTLSYSRELTDCLEVVLGYTYYDYPKADKDSDIQEPWVSLTISNLPNLSLLSINLFAGYDFNVSSNGPDEGWYYSWGIGLDIPLPECPFFQDAQTLGLSITNWGTDGAQDLKPCSLYATEISLSTTYNLGKLGITPSLNYVINHEDEINNGKEEFWVGLDLSYSF